MGRNADTARAGQRACTLRVDPNVLFDCLPSAFRDACRRCVVSGGTYDCKRIAAESTHSSLIANCAAKRVRECGDHPVAEQVAMLVVESLQVIEVAEAGRSEECHVSLAHSVPVESDRTRAGCTHRSSIRFERPR